MYRTGSNAANQPMTFEPVEVATAEADSPQEACRLAARRVTVYANQYLYAEPADEVDAEEAKIDATVTLEVTITPNLEMHRWRL